MRKTLTKLLLFVTLPFLFANNIKAQFPGEEAFKFKVDTAEVNNLIGMYIKEGCMLYQNRSLENSYSQKGLEIKVYSLSREYYKIEDGVIKQKIDGSQTPNLELVVDNSGKVNKVFMREYDNEGIWIASQIDKNVDGEFDCKYEKKEKVQKQTEFSYINSQAELVKVKFDENGNLIDVSKCPSGLLVKGYVVLQAEKKETKSPVNK